MKMHKRILSVVLAVLTVFSCAIGAVAEEIAPDENIQTIQAPTPYEAAVLKENLAAVCIRLADLYYYGVTDEDLLYRALCNTIDNGYFDFNNAVEYMMGLLKEDKYSEYYPPERYETVHTDITGEFYGIGVLIALSGDHLVVMGVYPDSPAEKAGIKLYDTILSVDEVNVEGKSVTDVANLIKREKGQKVTIGIKRDGQALNIDCYCDEFNQNPTAYEILEDGKIGYIYISDFTANLDTFIAPILKEFEEKGIKDVILDIRNNGGGELNAAIKLAEHFIPEGVISNFKYKNSELNEVVSVTNGLKENPYNLVLLVNENSASASELFASAVKDRKAGVLIGTNTYGKGSMQSMQRLHTGAGIKFTIAEFYSPDGLRIHETGIKPDFVIENVLTPVNEEEFEPVNLEKSMDISSGKHILAIEQRLHSLGCMESEPDENFDEETKEAIRYIQSVRNLEITGQPDLYTLVAINDIVYDFDIETDVQLEKAIEYVKTGEIKNYVAPVEEDTVPVNG